MDEESRFRLTREDQTRNLSHFEQDEEMKWRLQLEQKKRKKQEYTIQKKLQEEEEKDIKKQRAIKNMQYLLKRSRQFSKFFNDKLHEHTYEGSKKPLESKSQNKISKVVSVDDDEHNSTNDDVKYDIMEKLKYFKGVLKPYQVEGVTWMSILFENEVNGILADEMGLGKTVEVIALICHLYERQVQGPYLIVAPLSTVPNWASEFKRFAPDIPIVVFHGSKYTRPEIRSRIQSTHKLNGHYVKPVIITSYQIPIMETNFLRKFKWQYLIVDEGHRLKNDQSMLAKELNALRTTNRLLLTGTPLQNNLKELWALLNFLLPHIFKDAETFDSLLLMDGLEQQKATNEKADLISTVHTVLAPFMLRRLKTEVLCHLVPKKDVLVYCPISKLQKDLYTYIIQNDIEHLVNITHTEEEEPIDMPKRKRACRRDINYALNVWYDYQEDAESTKSAKSASNNNIVKYYSRIKMNNKMVMYKKVVNHPYLVHLPLNPDSEIPEPLIDENLVDESGKMLVLDAMLTKLKKRKHKVLLFSTLTMMLDLIEEYVIMRGYTYSRLDGSRSLDDRETNIKAFNTDPDVFLFLISTRAGGLGLNLTAADTVIFYDRDWNPQMDIQAQARCHRIGQTKPVMVYSLITKNTIDEKIVATGNMKRKLEKVVIKDGKFKTLGTAVKDEPDLQELKELRELIESDNCAQKIHSNGFVFSEEELDRLLDRQELYKEMQLSKQANKENL